MIPHVALVEPSLALVPAPEPEALPDDWRAGLSVGDVVAYRFPVAESDTAGEVIPKTRPCLVLDVEEHGGQRLALLAYGTGSETAANRGLEIHVDPAAADDATGLHQRTRFVAARRLLVPLRHGGFDAHPATGSPVLGRLSGAPLARLHAVRARLHAERDIAAERRRVRRGPPRPAVRGIDFTVEVRPARRALRGGDAGRGTGQIGRA